MERKNQLFNILEPNINVKNSIIGKIKKEEMKRTIYKIVFSSVVSLTSISIAIISIINVVKDAYQSGLSEYLSLLVSDTSLVFSFWQSYILSVTESLPIIPITIVLASVLIFVWSINSAIKTLGSTRSIFYKVN